MAQLNFLHRCFMISSLELLLSQTGSTSLAGVAHVEFSKHADEQRSPA
jgi:hypothetical protein